MLPIYRRKDIVNFIVVHEYVLLFPVSNCSGLWSLQANDKPSRFGTCSYAVFLISFFALPWR